MKIRLAVLASLLSGTIASLAEARTELAPACKARAAQDRSLREHGYVPIGGIDQWVVIDGADCANPVILFVHGGPGNPLSPVMDQLYGAWRKTFTIVTWDQRLSGRTYARNEPVTELTEERIAATSLTIERLVTDGLEVAEYLKTRLGKRKLILTGSSWGSVLGVHMAHEKPDSFIAYVGVSQLVENRKNESASYHAVYDMARRRRDETAMTVLEEIRPPPWTNPRNFGRMRRIVRAYEGELTTPAPQFTIAAEYASDADRAAYTAGEEISFIKYVGLIGEGMAAHVDLPALGTKYRLPMYLVQGEEDLLTRPEVTREWFESLRAPRKKLVMVPRAGHDPNFALIEAHFRVLSDEVAPLTK